MKDTKEKFKPGVEKRVLLLIAGLIWIAVGSMLLGFSYFWLRDAGNNIVLWTAGSGIIISLFVHHFGFLRVVDNNLGRILPMQGKRCVFLFMTWKSYILVLVMVATGILLRLSPIPRTYLSDSADRSLRSRSALSSLLSRLRFSINKCFAFPDLRCSRLNSDVLYIGIGAALILSSIRYLRFLIREIR